MVVCMNDCCTEMANGYMEWKKNDATRLIWPSFKPNSVPAMTNIPQTILITNRSSDTYDQLYGKTYSEVEIPYKNHGSTVWVSILSSPSVAV
jgi:hypothetical protein